MAVLKFKSSGSKTKTEKLQVEDFVVSEVIKTYKRGYDDGANQTRRSMVWMALILVVFSLIIGFMLIPAWWPYLPVFLEMLQEVISKIVQRF